MLVLVPFLNLFLLNDLTQDCEDKLKLLRLAEVITIILIWLPIACLIFSMVICSATIFYAISYFAVIFFAIFAVLVVLL